MKSWFISLLVVLSACFAPGCYQNPPFSVTSLQAPIDIISDGLADRVGVSIDNTKVLNYTLPAGSTWAFEAQRVKQCLCAADSSLRFTSEYLQTVSPSWKFWIQKPPASLMTAELALKYTASEIRAAESTGPPATTQPAKLNQDNVKFWVKTNDEAHSQLQVFAACKLLLQARRNINAAIDYYNATRDTPLPTEVK